MASPKNPDRKGRKRKTAGKRADGASAGRRRSAGKGKGKAEPEVAKPVVVVDGADPGADSDGDSDAEPDGDELLDEAASEQGVALVDVDDAALEAVTPAAAKGSASSRSVAKYDPLAAYMQEIRRFDLLSREEEHDLAVRLREEGDTDAARSLIEANLRLVVKIAYEYRRAYRNILDLVQEGNIGLMNAVRKYDPYRGVKLSSYAAWWIRAYILKFVLNNWRLVKIGTTQAQRKLFFNLRKEKEKLEQLGFKPEPKLLAERLDVSEKEVIEMEKRLSAPDASLDAPIAGDEDGGRTRLDIIGSGDSARPDVAVEQSQLTSILKSKLQQFADTLEGREETIFRDRWLTETPLTLQQIGDRYGISRERARQLEKRLLGRVRTYLERELGSAVDISALSRD